MTDMGVSGGRGGLGRARKSRVCFCKAAFEMLPRHPTGVSGRTLGVQLCSPREKEDKGSSRGFLFPRTILKLMKQ